MADRAAQVLIIEDERPIAVLLATIVRQMGHEAVTAADGAAGLAEAQKLRPDLILLDMLLPIMSGWEFLRVVTADPDLKSVPVILVSTVERVDQELQDKYPLIAKPFSPEAVRREVEAALGKAALGKGALGGAGAGV